MLVARDAFTSHGVTHCAKFSRGVAPSIRESPQLDGCVVGLDKYGIAGGHHNVGKKYPHRYVWKIRFHLVRIANSVLGSARRD